MKTNKRVGVVTFQWMRALLMLAMIPIVVSAGTVVGSKHDLVNAGGPGGMPDTSSSPNCVRCHTFLGGGAGGSLTPSAIMGLNLSDEHPINMTYPTAAIDSAFNVPPDAQDGWPNVKLYAGTLQCPSCHNVHDPTQVPFLRLSNVGSQLCVTCHTK